MNEIEKGMADFYRRAVDSLPVVPPAKPFEVKVIEQKTESVPFSVDNTTKKLEDEKGQVLAPPPPTITSINPNVVTSAGGTLITIIGSNFVSGATVKIAGLSASSVTFVNSTTLTCVTPADGLGFVTVEVINPSGQSISASNLLRYVNFPDNFLLSGPHSVAGYQGCALGPDYIFTVTSRLGNESFVPPPGVTIYAWIGVYQDAGSCGLENPFPVTITNATGATVSRTIAFAIRAVTPGSYGNANVFFAIWASSDGSIGTRYPTYGDTAYQPTSFLVNIAGSNPPPVGGGGGEFFSWTADPITGRLNPWNWNPGDLPHGLHVTKRAADGSVVTGYSGPAHITLSNLTNSPYLSVGFPSTITFASGVANLAVSASFNYQDVSNSQGYGYFRLIATDGSVVGQTPTCTALNHF